MLGHDRAHGAAPDSDALDRWRSGLAAVLRTESDDDRRLGAAIACRAVLSVLITAPGLDGRWFGGALEGVLEALPPADRYAGYVAFRRDRIAETGALELLAEGGAVDAVTRTVTPLGRWAVDVLAEPVVVAPAWADDEILQLRIDLGRFRPPVWRRVEVPAGTTLGQLHRIVQVLFEWADDHLHVFEIDGRSYADPIHDLGDAPTRTTSLSWSPCRGPGRRCATATTSATAGPRRPAGEPATGEARRGSRLRRRPRWRPRPGLARRGTASAAGRSGTTTEYRPRRPG